MLLEPCPFMACILLAFLSMELLYVDQLGHECNCIYDLCHQLYLIPPLQLVVWVKYYDPLIHVPLPNKEY